MNGVYKQISNAVPVKLAGQIAEDIKDALAEYEEKNGLSEKEAVCASFRF
ncbi:MAG: hypothetical protein IIZ33_01775 [Erysipelotrichaceae bacterium]|nr:hypothetical protein [Erysipelotrichaceae bacterium]